MYVCMMADARLFQLAIAETLPTFVSFLWSSICCASSAGTLTRAPVALLWASTLAARSLGIVASVSESSLLFSWDPKPALHGHRLSALWLSFLNDRRM